MAVRTNPFKPLLKKIPAPLRNRYFLVLAIFFALIIFFDKHDPITQWRLQQTVKKLEQDKLYYEEKIREVKADIRDVELNKEKFAREHYHMKKDNEDVYIIVEEEH